MIFVKSEDLKYGMRLAKPIYNKTGVLLYERNTSGYRECKELRVAWTLYSGASGASTADDGGRSGL